MNPRSTPSPFQLIRESFWARVEKGSPNGCWEWKGQRRKGYGRFRLSGLGRVRRWFSAHRIAWELFHDKAVPEDRSVLHHCDNPPCCRPGHLYLGDQLQNMRDRMERNRESYKGPRPALRKTLKKLKKGGKP